jgi:hypothetical protein
VNIYHFFSEVLLKNKYKDQHKYQGKHAILIFDKGIQNMLKKKVTYSTNECWENWISTYRRLKAI